MQITDPHQAWGTKLKVRFAMLANQEGLKWESSRLSHMYSDFRFYLPLNKEFKADALIDTLIAENLRVLREEAAGA